VQTPALPIDAAQVAAEAAALAARLAAGAPPPAARGTQYSARSVQPSALRLALRSPTRLVEAGRLVKPEGFRLRTLLARLLERLDALGARYGAGPTGLDPAALLRQAEGVRLVERRLVWRDLFRASGRHGRLLPMGGLVGEVVLEGDLAPLLPWLVWGTLVHVGKDAAMGNGLLSLDVG
jgi:hypothetical protein